MTKFLRKYNKLILVVGGALLMIAWLMPQMLQQMGRGGGNVTFMTVGGRTITAAQAAEAERHLFVVRELTGAGRALDGAAHWLLLTHEARAHGLIGGPADGREWIASAVDEMVQRSAMFGQPIAAEQAQANIEMMRDQTAATAGLSPTQADQALAEYRGVQRLMSLVGNSAGRVSDRRAVREGLRLFDQAVVDYVFIPADHILDQVPQPDDAALASHLERFRDVRPADGEFGIGYTLPPRAKVEWLELSREAIAGAARVDRVAVAERFLKENPGAQPSGPDFEAKRPIIEAALRKENADRAIAEAEKAIRSEFAKALRKLQKTGDAYTLPADWEQQRPDLNTVRDAVAEAVRRSGLEITPPTVVVKNADWLTADDLAKLPGIGTSYVQRGSSREPFAGIVLSVPAAGGKGDLGVQMNVPGSVSRDFLGNLYYFTVLDARPESPATSVDEIRDRLVQDQRRLEAFKILERDADVYRQRAASEGLEALMPQFPPGQSPPPGSPELRRAATVSRQFPPANEPRLAPEKARDAIMTAAQTLDPRVDASTLDADPRTIAVPIPSQLGIAVVRINAYKPLTTETYRQRDAQLSGQLARDLAIGEDNNPFGLDELAKRLGAKLPERRQDADGEL